MKFLRPRITHWGMIIVQDGRATACGFYFVSWPEWLRRFERDWSPKELLRGCVRRDRAFTVMSRSDFKRQFNIAKVDLEVYLRRRGLCRKKISQEI